MRNRSAVNSKFVNALARRPASEEPNWLRLLCIPEVGHLAAQCDAKSDEHIHGSKIGWMDLAPIDPCRHGRVRTLKLK